MIIETKHNMQEEVWVILKNKINKVTIIGINTSFEQKLIINYTIAGYNGTWNESDLFKTKEELIASL